MFFNNHACKILLILFRITAFFETFSIAIATLKLFDVLLKLWDESIPGFDFTNLKSLIPHDISWHFYGYS